MSYDWKISPIESGECMTIGFTNDLFIVNTTKSECCFSIKLFKKNNKKTVEVTTMTKQLSGILRVKK